MLSDVGGKGKVVKLTWTEKNISEVEGFHHILLVKRKMRYRMML